MKRSAGLLVALALGALALWLLLRPPSPPPDADPAERRAGTEDRPEGEDHADASLAGRQAPAEEAAPTRTGDASVRGRVVDDDGHGVPGVSVVALVRSRRNWWGTGPARTLRMLSRPTAHVVRPTAETTTDENGRFALFGLDTSRRYRIEARPPAPWSRAGEEPLEPPPYAGPLEIRLSTGHPLALRVVDADGRGVPAYVTVYGSRAGGMRPCYRDLPTGVDGRVAIDRVPTGTASVTVRIPGRFQRAYSVDVPASDEVVLPVQVADDAVVRGRVLTTAGMPVARATVVVVLYPTADAHGTWACLATTTAEDGHYRSEGLPPGRLQEVVASAPGHLRASFGGGRRVLEAGSETEVDLTLDRGIEILGRTTDEAGTPLAGVHVMASTRSGRGRYVEETFTDERGAFSLPAYPPGPVVVLAHLAGWYQPAQESGKVIAGGPAACRLELSESEEVKHLDVILRRGAPVSGRTLDADGAVLPDVTVRATPEWQGAGAFYDLWALTSFGTRSNAAGSFEFDGLPTGVRWRFETSTVGHVGQSEYYGPWTTTAPPAPIDLELQPTGRLAGRVVDTAGAPVPGVRVSVTNMRRSTRSNADGAFSLEDIPPGGRSLRTTDGRGNNLSDRLKVGLEPGESKAGLVLTVPVRHEVQGILVTAGDDPLPLTWMEWEPQPKDAGKPAMLRTNREGSFQAILWGNGPYRVRVGGAELPGLVNPGPDEIRLVHAGTVLPLEVRIVDSAGTLVPKAFVTVHTQRADGSLAVPAEVDGGVLVLQPGARGRNLQLAVTKPRDAAGRPLNLRPAKVGVPSSQDEVVIVLEAGSTLEGYVRDATGRPLAGMKVRVTPAAKTIAMRSVTTDADGRIEVAALPAGGAHVSLTSEDPWLPAAPLTVKDGAGFEIRLARGRPFLVEVLGPAGEGLPRVEVSLYGKYEGRGYRRRGETDARGRFEVAGVAPGETLTVNASTNPRTGHDFPPVSRKGVPCDAGSVVLRMNPGVRIEGEVVDPDGKPVRVGSVRSAKPDEDWTGRTRLSGTSNRFTLGPLEPGPYRLKASGSGEFADSLPVEVEAPSTGVRLVLCRKAQVEGRIRDAGEKTWTLTWANEVMRWGANLQDDGSFVMTEVRDIQGTLFAHEVDGTRYALLSGVRPSEGPFELVPQEGRSIAGRVRTSGSIERGDLYVHARRDLLLFYSPVEENGTFEIRALPDGVWRIEVYRDHERVRVQDGVEAGTRGLVLEGR